MFPPSGGGPPLSPSDVLRNPANWSEISRAEAVAAAGSGRVVVVGAAGRPEWFDANHPLFRGAGSYSMRAVRYYRYQERTRTQVAPLGVGQASPKSEDTPLPQKTTPVRPKTWVEIELVTEEGVPVPNERYTVKVPDGTTQSGTTDRRGQARIDGIDPGACEISFPGIDGRAWREG